MKTRHIFFAILMMTAAVLALGAADAEISTNLRVEPEYKMRTLLVRETYVDDAGKPVIAEDKGYATIHYTYGTGKLVTGIEFLDTEGNPVNSTEGYARIEKRYSRRTLAEQRYYDKDGNLVNGPEGYATQVTKGQWGDKQTTWQFDKDGNPVNLHRVVEYTKYSQYHLITSDSWYDAENNPATGPEGYSRIENDYVGANKARTAYLDENGKPCYYAKAGFATMLKEFKGTNETSISYYGEDGGRIPGPEGWSYALISYRVNGYKKTMWYNADGTPWFNNKGICGIEILQNMRKKIVEEYYFTGEGQRGRSTDGYSGVNRKYSKYGYLIIERYLDENDKPMVVEKLGYAKVVYTISDRKLKTREEYYDDKGKLTVNNNGYSVAVHSFEHGQQIASKYYDTDGKTPVNTADGYARVTYERDENKKVIRTNWYDKDGNPCAGESGAEEVRNKWERNNKISESYWTADNRPVTGPDGANEIRMEYNGNNKVIKKTLLDATGRPMTGKDGYAIVDTEYNSDGGVMSIRYYDENGGLMRAPGKEYAYERTVLMKDLGFIGQEEGEEIPADSEDETPGDEEQDAEGETETEADDSTEETYSADASEPVSEPVSPVDPEGNTAEGVKGSIVEYYGTDGKLMTLSSGYAYIVRINNAAGKVIEESYGSVDGEPVTLAAGYAKIKREYDAYGALSREAYFDQNDGKVTLPAGYHCFTRINDQKGNALKTAYFDQEDKPVINRSINSHRVDRTYLDARHILSEAWFDTDGKACPSTDTYARIERTFDRNGNIEDEKTFDANGRAISRKDGYDENVQLYNEKNQLIQIQYLTDGKLHNDINNVAVVQRKYDDEGNIAEEWYLDQDGIATTNLKTKYHRVVRTYLDATHVTSEAWFDPWGDPATTGDTFVQIVRAFDEKGNTIQETTYGPFQRKIARAAGYDEARNTFDEQNRIVKIEYLLDGALVLRNDGVAVIQRVYDEKGNVAAESYNGADGEPVMIGGNKYHRVEREYDSARHPVSEAWFDTEGQPIAQGDTFVRIRRTYDGKGNLASEVTCDAEGQPVARNAGFDETRNTYDEFRRVIRIDYLLGGALVLRNDGIATIQRTYDEKSCIAEESYYGVKGEPVLLGGNRYQKIVREWDYAKRAISEAWFDADGQPMPQGDTFVRIRRAYDQQGNLVSEVTCDEAGTPIARNAGYDETRNIYNEKNQAVRIEYYLNGNPVLRNDGIAVIEREYDEKGCVERESYYGVNGEPVLLGGNRYHRIDRTWLDANHVLDEAWFDVNGKPITTGDTYCAIEREYDEAGNVSVMRYRDADGNPVACKAGYEMVQRRYNGKNQMIHESYTDQTGTLKANAKGVYQASYDYNELGKVSKELYLDRDGKPMRNSDGIAEIRREYDEKGNLVSETYRDENGTPAAPGAGYDQARNTYDEQNRIVKIEYLLDGALVLRNDGVAVIQRVYDEKGNVAAESYYGADGEPVMIGGNKYHRVEREYDSARHPVSEAWFDTEGQPIAQGDTFVRIRRTYDGKGNLASEVTCDAEGQPVARNAGFDETRNTYDEFRRVIRIEYYLDGNPVLRNDGIAVIEREYDGNGNIAAESYYGVNGEPVLLGGNRYQKIVREWDSMKRAISEAWFDVDGKPMTQGNTFVRIEREYDENGNSAVERYYGPDGAAIACAAGYEMVWKRYNDKKQVVYESYMKHSGEPMTNGKGVYQTTYDYNEQGKVVLEQYFDAQGQPMKNNDGYVKVVRTWNEDGTMASEAGES